MQNFLSLGYMLRVLLAVSSNFPYNPRKYAIQLYLETKLNLCIKQVAFF